MFFKYYFLNFRVATPYGGFDKGPRGITFKLPEVDLNLPRFPELNESRMKRPTFNRTAQGWISEGTHLIIPTITLEPTSVPESDDLQNIIWMEPNKLQPVQCLGSTKWNLRFFLFSHFQTSEKKQHICSVSVLFCLLLYNGKKQQKTM